MITGSRLSRVSDYKIFLPNQIKSSFLIFLFPTVALSMCNLKNKQKNPKRQWGNVFFGLKKGSLIIQKKQIQIAYIYFVFNCPWACANFECINSCTFPVLMNYSGNNLIFYYSSFAFLLPLYFVLPSNVGLGGRKAQ